MDANTLKVESMHGEMEVLNANGNILIVPHCDGNIVGPSGLHISPQPTKIIGLIEDLILNGCFGPFPSRINSSNNLPHSADIGGSVKICKRVEYDMLVISSFPTISINLSVNPDLNQDPPRPLIEDSTVTSSSIDLSRSVYGDN